MIVAQWNISCCQLYTHSQVDAASLLSQGAVVEDTLYWRDTEYSPQLHGMFGFLARSTTLMLMVLVLILNSHCTLAMSPLTQPPQSTIASFQTMRPCFSMSTKVHHPLAKAHAIEGGASVVGVAFPVDSRSVVLPLSFHLWRKICLVQLSTILPNYQYMLSN